MQTKEVKAWLSRGYRLAREKKILEDTRNETYERLTSLTASTGGVVVSGTKDPNKMDALVILNAEIDVKMAQIDAARLEIYEAISALPVSDYRFVLVAHYLNRKKWNIIAQELSYSERTIHRIHGAALAAIEPIIREKIGGHET